MILLGLFCLRRVLSAATLETREKGNDDAFRQWVDDGTDQQAKNGGDAGIGKPV